MNSCFSCSHVKDSLSSMTFVYWELLKTLLSSQVNFDHVSFANRQLYLCQHCREQLDTIADFRAVAIKCVTEQIKYWNENITMEIDPLSDIKMENGKEAPYCERTNESLGTVEIVAENKELDEVYHNRVEIFPPSVMIKNESAVKKKRALWSEDRLSSAMADVKSGKLSQHAAATRYNIPRRTLRNHLISEKPNKKLGRSPTLSISQERDLVDSIIKFYKKGVPITSRVVREQTYKFCKKQGIENNFCKVTQRAGKDWFKKFMKRNLNLAKYMTAMYPTEVSCCEDANGQLGTAEIVDLNMEPGDIYHNGLKSDLDDDSHETVPKEDQKQEDAEYEPRRPKNNNQNRKTGGKKKGDAITASKSDRKRKYEMSPPSVKDEICRPAIKKKRALWSEDSLISAMADVKSGKLSQHAAATRYNIPRRTLRNHLISEKPNKKIGRSPTLSISQEKDFVDKIIKFSKIGITITSRVIREQTYRFCEKQGIENNFCKVTRRAGNDWFKMFLKRNPNLPNYMTPMNPTKARKLDIQILQSHFEKLNKLYDELDVFSYPERLYNVDDKCCQLNINQSVLAVKGNSNLAAQEYAENLTVATCVNAAGSNIPPMLIYKGTRFKQEFRTSLPPGTLVTMAPDANMTNSLFINFIEHLAKYKSSEKCLLIFDGDSWQLDYDIVETAEKYNIALCSLPSNTLQTLNKTIEKAFEAHWNQEILRFLQQPTEKININQTFTKVWTKSLTLENIIDGFNTTRLFPFNPNALKDANLTVPPTITKNLKAELSSTTNMISASTPRQSLENNSDIDMDLTNVVNSAILTVIDSSNDVSSLYCV